MADTINDGGPAFPRQFDFYPNARALVMRGESGMSLRDHDAIEAMKSLILLCAHDDTDGLEYEDYIAKRALGFADAYLREKANG